MENVIVTIQGKDHEWTRIHTNEGEGIGTPVSDPARDEWEESRRVGDRRSVLREGDSEGELARVLKSAEIGGELARR